MNIWCRGWFIGEVETALDKMGVDYNFNGGVDIGGSYLYHFDIIDELENQQMKELGNLPIQHDF